MYTNSNLLPIPVIYLSPSNQPANRYAVGNTNEKREMEAVARQIQVFYDLCPVLAETNFHDNPKTAQWIIDHKDVIAIAYVQALVKTLGLIQKSSSIMPNIEEGNKVQYYRVQVGAFLEKSNAEALQRKLKAAGYDSIIKKD